MGKSRRKNEEERAATAAEQLYQEEIDALIAAEQDPVPTGWRMSPPFRPHLYHGRNCWRKGNHTQIHRKPQAGGNRHCHPGNGQGPMLLIGEPGTANVLAVRAPDRSHQRGFHQGDTGNRRHHGGAHTLFMELRHAHSPGAVQGGHDKKPCIPRHGDRQHCPF